MTTTPELALLTIPALVKELVLFHLGRSEGGVQALLNLRLTCRETKRWIDNQCPSTGGGIFSRAQIRIEYSVESIKRFLKTLPPFHVKSLVLDAITFRESERLNVVEKYRNQFTSFWVERLECLEVKNDRRIILISQIIELLGSQKLKSLKFSSFSITEKNTSVLKLMCANPNLLYFETSISLVDVSCLQNIINAKCENKKFKLVVTILETEDLNYDAESVKKFRNSIVASNSKHVLRMSMLEDLELLLSGLKYESRQKICSSVESIAAVNKTLAQLKPNEFPNLKSLGQVHMEEFIKYRISWPNSPMELGFSESILFLFTSFLPFKLTSIKINIELTSLSRLLLYLSSLAEDCPHLKFFDAECRFGEISGHHANKIKSVAFPRMKSFRFRGSFQKNDSESVEKLVAVLGIHELGLHHLYLSFLAPTVDQRRMLDKDTVRNFCEGNLAQTLQSLDICDYMVAISAQGLIEELRAKVQSNRRKIEQTLGRRYVFNPTSFDPFCCKQMEHPHCNNFKATRHEKKLHRTSCNIS